MKKTIFKQFVWRKSYLFVLQVSKAKTCGHFIGPWGGEANGGYWKHPFANWGAKNSRTWFSLLCLNCTIRVAASCGTTHSDCVPASDWLTFTASLRQEGWPTVICRQPCDSFLQQSQSQLKWSKKSSLKKLLRRWRACCLGWSQQSELGTTISP